MPLALVQAATRRIPRSLLAPRMKPSIQAGLHASGHTADSEVASGASDEAKDSSEGARSIIVYKQSSLQLRIDKNS